MWKAAAVAADGSTLTLRPFAASVPAKPYSPISPGNIAPDFSTVGLDGKPIHLMAEAAKAKLVLLHFWTAFDDPSRDDFPMLRRFDAQYRAGLRVIGVIACGYADLGREVAATMD